MFFLLVEVMLGKWGSEDTPFLNYQFKQKSVIDRSAIDVGNYPETITRLPTFNGFRFSSEKEFLQNKDCLIITLGGSTTQEYILEEKETWSYKLQNLVNQKYLSGNRDCSGRYQVVNAGISGHGLVQNVWLLKNWIKGLEVNPKALIIYQGINDFHTNLNRPYSDKDIERRIFLNEFYFDVKFRSFFYNKISQIKSGFKERNENKPVSKLQDGVLYKVPNYKRNFSPFHKESLGKDFIHITESFGGVRYHKRLIKEFIDYSNQNYPNAKIIFITQTQSICDLTNFPNWVKYRSRSVDLINKKKIEHLKFNSWLTARGVCLRLGINKNSYLSVVRNHKSAEIIDYAGQYVESLNESYDDYHKTPEGSKIFFNRVANQLIQKLNHF